MSSGLGRMAALPIPIGTTGANRILLIRLAGANDSRRPSLLRADPAKAEEGSSWPEEPRRTGRESGPRDLSRCDRS